MYGVRLHQRFPDILGQVVPVLCGTPHHGHTSTYSDGNAKARLCCMNLREIYSTWFAEDIDMLSPLHKTQNEYRVCSESIYNGNGSTVHTKTCKICAVLYLTRTPLEKNEIKSFVQYCFLKDKRDRSKSNKKKEKLLKVIEYKYKPQQRQYYDDLRSSIASSSMIENNERDRIDSIDDENENDKECEGDRKKENINVAEHSKTAGIFALCVLSGFGVTMSEIVYSESKTQAILRTYEAFTTTEMGLLFFCTLWITNGYDMMCNILFRLLGVTLARMMGRSSAVANVLYFWYCFGLNRLYIDAFHIFGHVLDICQYDEQFGLLHPYLSKFKGLFRRDTLKVNHQFVEQLWVETNKCKAWRLMEKDLFCFFLLLKIEYMNHYNKIKLEKEDYCWEKITNWKQIRTFSTESTPSTFTRMPTIEQLVEMKTIKNIERCAFDMEITATYWSVWERPDERQPIYCIDNQVRMLRDVSIAYIGFLKHFELDVNLQSLKEYVVQWKNIDFYKNHEPYIKDLLKVYQ
eukprot:463151_1